jgi:hypothetical protein
LHNSQLHFHAGIQFAQFGSDSAQSNILVTRHLLFNLLPLNRRSSTGASRVPLVAGHTHPGDGNRKIFFLSKILFFFLSLQFNVVN